MKLLYELISSAGLRTNGRSVLTEPEEVWCRKGQSSSLPFFLLQNKHRDDNSYIDQVEERLSG